MNIEDAREQYYKERSNYINKYLEKYSQYLCDNEYTNKIQNEKVEPMPFKEYLKRCPRCKADKSALYGHEF